MRKTKLSGIISVIRSERIANSGKEEVTNAKKLDGMAQLAMRKLAI